MLRLSARTVFLCLFGLTTLLFGQGGSMPSVSISRMDTNPPSYQLIIDPTETSVQYDVERADILASASWNPIGTFTGNGGTVIFYDNTIGSANEAFYRV